ncbi:unnamed protein product [Lymnaea stagnalis]|uniref:SOCS box domain-containing protein n=1 Tax=Lymnaea stagnalis TaxID=6523 RepID=A0AAV2H5J4_LYMST
MAAKTKEITNVQLSDFFSAVRSGNCSKVKSLLKKKEVKINATDPTDPSCPTALIIASQLELIEMVKVLMRAKPTSADVNAETKSGRRAIWWPAKNGNVELAKVILGDKKCEINYIDKETGCSPLYRAITSNSVEVATELVHAGADVNIRRLGYDVGAETPLIKSVQMNNIDISRLLINSLCNIQAKTDDGLNALHFAVAYRRYEITELLLESKVKVNAKSKHGVTAMTVAIEQHSPYMVRLLIQFGYNLDRPYSWGESPLEQAIKLHSNRASLTLIHWGCKLIRKPRLPSYFYLAVNEKQWDVAQLLININPKYLQEKWLRQSKWPVSVYYEQDMRHHLLEMSNKVWTLKELCRSKVFMCVGKYAPIKITQLPIPESVKEYVMFNEFIKESFYEKKPLDFIACPYECPTFCSQWNCSPLDITVSSDSDVCETGL